VYDKTITTGEALDQIVYILSKLRAKEVDKKVHIYEMFGKY